MNTKYSVSNGKLMQTQEPVEVDPQTLPVQKVRLEDMRKVAQARLDDIDAQIALLGDAMTVATQHGISLAPGEAVVQAMPR